MLRTSPRLTVAMLPGCAREGRQLNGFPRASRTRLLLYAQLLLTNIARTSSFPHAGILSYFSKKSIMRWGYLASNSCSSSQLSQPSPHRTLYLRRRWFLLMTCYTRSPNTQFAISFFRHGIRSFKVPKFIFFIYCWGCVPLRRPFTVLRCYSVVAVDMRNSKLGCLRTADSGSQLLWACVWPAHLTRKYVSSYLSCRSST